MPRVNNVKNADIKNADVKNADIKNADVKNADVKNADVSNANSPDPILMSHDNVQDNDDENYSQVIALVSLCSINIYTRTSSTSIRHI